MRKTPVYLAPLELTEDGLGRLMRSFYWGGAERLLLVPLPMPAARQLLECVIAKFGLPKLELQEFRDEIPSLSDRVLGAIAGMCVRSLPIHVTSTGPASRREPSTWIT